MNNYFVLFNSKREKLLCSWGDNEPDFHNQKVHYIGITNGLGGYKDMLNKGWFDRRDFKNYYNPNSKIKSLKFLLNARKHINIKIQELLKK